MIFGSPFGKKNATPMTFGTIGSFGSKRWWFEIFSESLSRMSDLTPMFSNEWKKRPISSLPETVVWNLV